MNEEITLQGASITGTSEADNLTVSADDVTLDAGDGNDELLIVGQNNSVDGGTGDNIILVFGKNNSLETDDGQNLVMVFNDSNAIELGNGDNTVITFTPDAEDDTLDPPESNVISTGDGNDSIGMRGNFGMIMSGDGDDTIEIEGDGNLIFGGYDYDEEAPPISDNDRVTVTGGNNTVYGGSGRNTAEIVGDGNMFAGAGLDTIRADINNGTITGAVDVELIGDGNRVTVNGGRLWLEGDDNRVNVTGGSIATIIGDETILYLEDSRATVLGDVLLVDTGRATLDVSTLTSGLFSSGLYTEDDELTFNGRRLKGKVFLTVYDGEISMVDASPNGTIEGFEGLPIRITDTLTADGVTFELFTVPSALESDGEIVVTDNVIEGLGWSEGLRISKGGRYTVNGYLFDVAPNDTLVGTDEWAGIQRVNTVDNILFNGSNFNDNIENYGAGVTIDSGLGSDYISLGSAGREFVALDANSFFEVEGFQTGFDNNADVVLSDGNLSDFRFDFETTGVQVFYKDAELDLINSGDESVNFLLRNGDNLIKFTAVNADMSVGATGADFYAFNGAATVNNYTGGGFFNGAYFATDGRVTVEVGGDAMLSAVTGIGAGNRFAVGSTTFTVSGDGSSIVSGGGLMWAGSNVAAVNLLGLKEIIDDTTSTAPIDDTTSGAPIDDTTSTAPIDDTPSEAPVDDTTSTAPIDDTTSEAPVDDTTLTAPFDDTLEAPSEETTSTAPADDTPLAR